MAYVGRTAFGGEDPGAESPGWVVADVLGVAALEVGDPVGLVVLVKGDDFAFGHGGSEDFNTEGAEFTERRETEKPAP